MSVAYSEEGGVGASAEDAAVWEEFTASSTFELLAKYMALGEKLGKEDIAHKLFSEARPLGKGAFGAVFLVFKKVCEIARVALSSPLAFFSALFFTQPLVARRTPRWLWPRRRWSRPSPRRTT